MPSPPTTDLALADADPGMDGYAALLREMGDGELLDELLLHAGDALTVGVVREEIERRER